MVATSAPPRASTQAMTELEFHISSASSSSRPQTGVGTDGRTSRIRRAMSRSSVNRTGLADRGVQIGDAPASPASDLVAERAEASGPSHSDRSFHDDAALLRRGDRVRALARSRSALPARGPPAPSDRGRGSSTPSERRDPLEHLAADSDYVRSCAEWDPIQVHGS